MKKQKEDKGTRQRLLSAACEIFAKKGFHDARIADICKLASANVASVNYYFTNKANLYAETWKYAFQQFEDPAFSNSSLGSPEEMLKSYIHAIMKDFTAKGRMGYFSRLYMMELAKPTGLIQDTWRELIEPKRQKLHHIIREIMGKNANDQRILLCELSIINQCRTLLTVHHSDLEYLLAQKLTKNLIKNIADHIFEFSLAGIKAVGKIKK